MDSGRPACAAPGALRATGLPHERQRSSLAPASGAVFSRFSAPQEGQEQLISTGELTPDSLTEGVSPVYFKADKFYPVSPRLGGIEERGRPFLLGVECSV